jgi:hypothetical protein
MQQRINLTQTDLNEVAATADRLSVWLGETAVLAASHIAIPTEVTVVASFVVTAGTMVFLDGAIPASECWCGGCSI